MIQTSTTQTQMTCAPLVMAQVKVNMMALGAKNAMVKAYANNFNFIIT